LRAVVEDVTEMCVALRARYFDAAHAVAPVLMLLDIPAGRRLVEARPASARVELRARLEEPRIAADAPISALAVLVPVGAREGALGSLLSRHTELLRRELTGPLLIGLFEFVRHEMKIGGSVRSSFLRCPSVRFSSTSTGR
jgi:hypothetical protein